LLYFKHHEGQGLAHQIRLGFVRASEWHSQVGVGHETTQVAKRDDHTASVETRHLCFNHLPAPRQFLSPQPVLPAQTLLD
jgi:hypothetical protein